MTKRKAPGDLLPRTKFTKEECARGGESVARLYPVEQEEWSRRGGLKSAEVRRAKAAARKAEGGDNGIPEGATGDPGPS